MTNTSREFYNERIRPDAKKASVETFLLFFEQRGCQEDVDNCQMHQQSQLMPAMCVTRRAGAYSINDETARIIDGAHCSTD
jgi:hypothetical protein